MELPEGLLHQAPRRPVGEHRCVEISGRPHNESLPWPEEGCGPNSDLWARADESRADILGRYRRAWAHAQRLRRLRSLLEPSTVVVPRCSYTQDTPADPRHRPAPTP